MPLGFAAAAGFFLEGEDRDPFFLAVVEEADLFFFKGVRDVVVFHRHCAEVQTAGESNAEGGVAVAVGASACSSTGLRADGMASKLQRPREDIFACAKCGSVPRDGQRYRDLSAVPGVVVMS